MRTLSEIVNREIKNYNRNFNENFSIKETIDQSSTLDGSRIQTVFIENENPEVDHKTLIEKIANFYSYEIKKRYDKKLKVNVIEGNGSYFISYEEIGSKVLIQESDHCIYCTVITALD